MAWFDSWSVFTNEPFHRKKFNVLHCVPANSWCSIIQTASSRPLFRLPSLVLALSISDRFSIFFYIVSFFYLLLIMSKRPIILLSPWVSRSPNRPHNVRFLQKQNTTVLVELLHPIDTYGMKGSIVPAPRGLMRNHWYPRGQASYLSPQRLEHLRALEAQGEVSFGRDTGFNVDQHIRALQNENLRAISAQQDVMV